MRQASEWKCRRMMLSPTMISLRPAIFWLKSTASKFLSWHWSARNTCRYSACMKSGSTGPPPATGSRGRLHTESSEIPDSHHPYSVPGGHCNRLMCTVSCGAQDRPQAMAHPVTTIAPRSLPTPGKKGASNLSATPITEVDGHSAEGVRFICAELQCQESTTCRGPCRTSQRLEVVQASPVCVGFLQS